MPVNECPAERGTSIASGRLADAGTRVARSTFL